jgi:quercetin dioxygenase-like cupin family protein
MKIAPTAFLIRFLIYNILMKKKCYVTEPTNSSAVYRHKSGHGWAGVGIDRYKQVDGGWLSITRQFLVGKRGESARFHLRYFEIAPGGYSSLETHRHEHVVICARGKGRVRMGDKSFILKNLDVAYVSPDTAHQLLNPYEEPFGFFCIVNAKRDRPKPVKSGEKQGGKSKARK